MGPKKGKLPKPKIGALLISEPFNRENHFRRAVVLISQHDERGSIGFILNKPTEMKIHEVLDDFPEFDAPVYWGGNQHLDHVYFLHTRGDLANSRLIANNIYWGGNYDQLKLWVETKQIKPEEIKFMAGYAAWSPRQLAKEIRTQNWWVADSDLQSAFNEPSTLAWGNILQRHGHVYGIMNDFPEDPNIN